MTRPAKEILNAVIKLPERDRLLIVEELLASLEPADDQDVDAAWRKKLTDDPARSSKVSSALSPGKK